MNYVKDISLYNDDGTVNVIIEICPDSNNKSELASPNFDKLITVRKVVGFYPFYYGSFPQTYADDKDPLDFILFTGNEHKQLDVVKVDVIGAIHTVDCGEIDDKIICVEHGCKIKKIKKQLKTAIKFLFKYKGNNSGMIIQKKLVSMADAEALVSESHKAFQFWQNKGVKPSQTYNRTKVLI